MVTLVPTKVLESDLPRAEALLKSLEEQVMAVTAQVQELTKKSSSEDISYREGLNLLEVKGQLVLLYNTLWMSHLILDKTSELQGHAAVLKLAEICTVLEKLCPLDQKLKY